MNGTQNCYNKDYFKHKPYEHFLEDKQIFEIDVRNINLGPDLQEYAYTHICRRHSCMHCLSCMFFMVSPCWAILHIHILHKSKYLYMRTHAECKSSGCSADSLLCQALHFCMLFMFIGWEINKRQKSVSKCVLKTKLVFGTNTSITYKHTNTHAHYCATDFPNKKLINPCCCMCKKKNYSENCRRPWRLSPRAGLTITPCTVYRLLISHVSLQSLFCIVQAISEPSWRSKIRKITCIQPSSSLNLSNNLSTLSPFSSQRLRSNTKKKRLLLISAVACWVLNSYGP